jgi:hypothetical protein
MTPKEKAQELFGKYAIYLRANLRYDEEANEDAKVCALIAVDEILSLLWSVKTDVKYFTKVKQEIEKL